MRFLFCGAGSGLARESTLIGTHLIWVVSSVSPRFFLVPILKGVPVSRRLLSQVSQSVFLRMPARSREGPTSGPGWLEWGARPQGLGPLCGVDSGRLRSLIPACRLPSVSGPQVERLSRGLCSHHRKPAGGGRPPREDIRSPTGHQWGPGLCRVHSACEAALSPVLRCLGDGPHSCGTPKEAAAPPCRCPALAVPL